MPDPRLEADRIKPFLDRFGAAVERLGPIENLVVDLRYAVDVEMDAWTTYWLGLFTDKPLELAHYLQREHESLNEYNTPNNSMRQRWSVDGGDVLARAKWDAVIRKPILIPVLFVVNNASYPRYSRTLDALQRAGRAAVLWEDSGCSVGSDVERFANGRIRMYLNARYLISGQHLAAAGGARPNHRSAQRLSDEQLAAIAPRLLTGLAPSPPQTSVAIPLLKLRPFERPLEVLTSREQRLFWMMKVWMGIRHYFPHLEYASVDWSTALQKWTERFEAAHNADEFFDLVRQMTAPLNDSHIQVVPQFGDPGRTQYFPQVRIGRVEGKVIVTGLDGNAGQLGIAPGDEVVSIDGKNVTEIEESMRMRISASTEGAFHRQWNRQTGAKTQTNALVGFRRPGNGPVGFVKLPRIRTQPLRFRYTPVVSLDHDAIGYLNLFEFKTEEELRAPYDKVRRSRGLLIDLRGYPTYIGLNSFWQQRLYTRRLKGLIAENVMLVRDVPNGISTIKMYEHHDPIPGEHYSGAVVMLINAEAQSYPEGLAIDLKTDSRVTYVGSPTAGTTGGTVPVALPGGWWIEFTGVRVSHPDGTRFQNVGVLPDVPVEPTIRGIAAGADEVYEKGLVVLRAKISSAAH